MFLAPADAQEYVDLLPRYLGEVYISDSALGMRGVNHVKNLFGSSITTWHWEDVYRSPVFSSQQLHFLDLIS